jgi:fatty acid desaturase
LLRATGQTYSLFGFGFDFTILFFLTYFVMFPIIRFMGDYFDHGQLVAVTSGIQSKNHPRVGWIVELLFLPMNDKFHLVHHLFPKIPSKNLGQAHIFLLGSSRTYKQLHSEYDGALVSSLDSTMVREFHD